jgi:hypothetical protein
MNSDTNERAIQPVVSSSPASRLFRRLAGLAWTAGNAFLLYRAGLNADFVLAAAAIGTFTAGLVSLVFANRLDRSVGPTYVVSSCIFTGKHVFNALTGGGQGYPAEWLHSSFGALCTAGLVIGFYGKKISDALQPDRPIARFLNRIPIKQGTAAALTMNLAYCFELRSGVAAFQRNDLQSAAISFGMIGLWVVGDCLYGVSVNLQKQLNLKSQARLSPPQIT